MSSVVGRVTSGSFAPALDRPIAMAYVPPEFAEVGSGLDVTLHGGATAPAKVVALPFYRRK